MKHRVLIIAASIILLTIAIGVAALSKQTTPSQPSSPRSQASKDAQPAAPPRHTATPESAPKPDAPRQDAPQPSAPSHQPAPQPATPPKPTPAPKPRPQPARPAPAPKPAPAPTPAPRPTPPPAPPTPSKYDVGPPDVYEIIELVNAERAARGRGGLRGAGTIFTSAKEQSNYMASINAMSHEGGLARLKRHTPNCGAGAENIQQHNSGATSRDAFLLWKNSGPHLTNMLGAYTRTGVGITAKGGWYYITMQFCS